MSGLIRQKIDSIVEQRSKGNPTIASTTRTKLVLKGINPENYGPNSPDDPAVLDKLRTIAKDLGVAI